jgi:hypothetical protein
MRNVLAVSGLHRRRVLSAMAALAWSPAIPAQAVRDTSQEVLSLYGVTLKDAGADAFVAAARAAGGVPVAAAAGSPPVLDTRGSGVPALERLTLIAHEGKVVTVRFTVKNYGQDNEALRRALLDKYGVPLAVSARPLPAQGFDGRASPRGGYFWTFAGGMKLIYDHPRVGDVTLSYTDEAKEKALAAGALTPDRAPPKNELRDRL